MADVGASVRQRVAPKVATALDPLQDAQIGRLATAIAARAQILVIEAVVAVLHVGRRQDVEEGRRGALHRPQFVQVLRWCQIFAFMLTSIKSFSSTWSSFFYFEHFLGYFIFSIQFRSGVTKVFLRPAEGFPNVKGCGPRKRLIVSSFTQNDSVTPE